MWSLKGTLLKYCEGNTARRDPLAMEIRYANAKHVNISVVARSRQHTTCYSGDLYTESGQTLHGPFSAASKPIFAAKYAL